jgi:putative membrane protein
MSESHDPRVFFAAERTALAWNRTALALMAFGFAIERFGLFMKMLLKDGASATHSGPSFWFGLIFILLGCFFSFAAALQYKKFLTTLTPAEIPRLSHPNLAFILNIVIGTLAVTMMAYLVVSNGGGHS